MFGRVIFSALVSIGLACTAVGCAASADDSAEPVSDVTSKLEGCSMTRAQILASASPSRKIAVQRGFEWLDANVPYSQAASHEGYRTDCSGFVSMCWNMGRSSNTSSFYSGDANTRLGSYEDLVVADALVKQGHIVLFLGWNDAAHNGVCVLEQSSTANDMQFRVRTKASLVSSGYKAIRAKSLANDLTPGPVHVPDTLPPDTKPEPRPLPGTDDVPGDLPEPNPADESDLDEGTDTGSVSTQSDEVGDPGDPDEQEESTDEDDDKPSKSSRKRSSASEELASAGCSTSPGQSGQAMSWLPLVGALLVVARRRRR